MTMPLLLITLIRELEIVYLQSQLNDLLTFHIRLHRGVDRVFGLLSCKHYDKVLQSLVVMSYGCEFHRLLKRDLPI